MNTEFFKSFRNKKNLKNFKQFSLIRSDVKLSMYVENEQLTLNYTTPLENENYNECKRLLVFLSCLL